MFCDVDAAKHNTYYTVLLLLMKNGATNYEQRSLIGGFHILQQSLDQQHLQCLAEVIQLLLASVLSRQ